MYSYIQNEKQLIICKPTQGILRPPTASGVARNLFVDTIPIKKYVFVLLFSYLKHLNQPVIGLHVNKYNYIYV